MVLFGCGLLGWQTVPDERQRQRINLKARLSLATRRVVTAAALGVWLIVLLLAGSLVPASIAGTLNVIVLAGLVLLFRASPTERHTTPTADHVQPRQGRGDHDR